jgi:hypothetical protein
VRPPIPYRDPLVRTPEDEAVARLADLFVDSVGAMVRSVDTDPRLTPTQRVSAISRAVAWAVVKYARDNAMPVSDIARRLRAVADLLETEQSIRDAAAKKHGVAA